MKTYINALYMLWGERNIIKKDYDNEIITGENRDILLSENFVHILNLLDTMFMGISTVNVCQKCYRNLSQEEVKFYGNKCTNCVYKERG